MSDKGRQGDGGDEDQVVDDALGKSMEPGRWVRHKQSGAWGWLVRQEGEVCYVQFDRPNVVMLRGRAEGYDDLTMLPEAKLLELRMLPHELEIPEEGQERQVEAHELVIRALLAMGGAEMIDRIRAEGNKEGGWNIDVTVNLLEALRLLD